MNEQRQLLLDAMKRLSILRPEFRFGQLLIAMTYIVRPAIMDSIYDIEDDELLEAARLMMTPQENTDKSAA